MVESMQVTSRARLSVTVKAIRSLTAFAIYLGLVRVVKVSERKIRLGQF